METINHPSAATLATDVQAMETFIGVLAHEIRSQIVTICTISDILLDGQNRESVEQTEHITIIQSSSYSTLHVLDNMIQTARFSKGKLDLHPTTNRFHFKDWLCTFTEQIETTVAAPRNVKISINVENNVPEYVTTDAVKLGQILHNLISNAAKFSLPHTSIRLDTAAPNDKQLSFKVTD